MLYSEDHAYYSRRAAEERERGDQAMNPAVAAIHYELARCYSLLAEQTHSGPPELTMIDGGQIEFAPWTPVARQGAS